MRRHPIPVVAACIIKQYPLRILLHKKYEAKDEKGIKRDPELVGLWEFPGGMIEGKESPEQALRREVREELCGVPVVVANLIRARTVCFKDRKPYLILFYICRTDYKPTPPGCRYFKPKEILGMEDKIIPGDLEVVKDIIEKYNEG